MPWGNYVQRFRTVIIIMNGISMLIGFCLFTIGIMLIWSPDGAHVLLDDDMRPLLRMKIGKWDKNYVAMIFKLMKASSPIGIAMFVLGVSIAAVSIVGCIGGYCRNSVVLHVQVILVMLTTTGLLTAVVVFVMKEVKFTEQLIDVFGSSVNNYTSMNDNTTDGVVVAYVSRTFNCCGVDGPHDFKKASPTDLFNGVNYTNMQYPLMCCRLTQQYIVQDGTCPSTFTVWNSNIRTGCRSPLMEAYKVLLHDITLILIGTIIYLTIQIGFTIMTLYLESSLD